MFLVLRMLLLRISIHAPARGATRQTSMNTTTLCYFNSRPCERGDRNICKKNSERAYFNSRPCERGDLGATVDHLHQSLFQFTPLREGRPGR